MLLLLGGDGSLFVLFDLSIFKSCINPNTKTEALFENKTPYCRSTKDTVRVETTGGGLSNKKIKVFTSISSLPE